MGITCKQAVDYISKREEGRLSSAQRFRLWQHLAICRFCRLFNRQNALLGSLLKRRPVGASSDEPLNKDAIIEALQKAED